VDHGLRLLVGFLDLHRRRQHHVEHGQAIFAQFLHYATRQVGTRLELVDDDALDF
jgi:hypothetical protein